MGAKLTLEEAKRRVREKHGDKYNLDHLTSYGSQYDKVTLQCPKPGHEPFEKAWNKLWLGQGCLDCSPSPSFRDLTGKRFGELVVLRRGPNHERANGRHRTTWVCRCDCGEECEVVADKLKRKKYPQRSCGHWQELNDLTGQTFGQLTATENYQRTDNGTEWWCVCACGRSEQWFRQDHLLSGATQRCKLCWDERKGWDSVQRFQDEPWYAKTKTFLYFVEVRGVCDKFGLAKDLDQRSKSGGGGGHDYTKCHFKKELSRAEAWAVEQTCLELTRKHWSPNELTKLGLRYWGGWTECRLGLEVDEWTKKVSALADEAETGGWEALVTKHARHLLGSEGRDKTSKPC